jgi:microcystin-dependent protein
MQVFVGTIMTFGFNFSPIGWQPCNGQLLSISQNQVLFTLIGTTFGGDGVQTFQLPNMQGRMAISQGTGGGLSTRVMGEFGGNENASILISNMASHTHTATFTPSGSSGYKVSTNTAGNVTVPTATNNVLAGSPSGQTAAAIWATSTPAPTIPLGGSSGSGGGTVTNAQTGNSVPLPVMNPFLAVNFSISLFGIFPSRN